MFCLIHVYAPKLLEFILYRTLCGRWAWSTLSFPILGTFLTIIFSNIFSDPFPFSPSSKTPILQMLMLLMLLRILWDSTHFFSFYSLSSCSLAFISIILSSSSLICSSASAILLLIASSIFFISVIGLFIIDCLFFSYSGSLLNIPYIFFISGSTWFLRQEYTMEKRYYL